MVISAGSGHSTSRSRVSEVDETPGLNAEIKSVWNVIYPSPLPHYTSIYNLALRSRTLYVPYEFNALQIMVDLWKQIIRQLTEHRAQWMDLVQTILKFHVLLSNSESLLG
jgi:hypothetical protein